jgi:hypothetical protein
VRFSCAASIRQPVPGIEYPRTPAVQWLADQPGRTVSYIHRFAFFRWIDALSSLRVATRRALVQVCSTVIGLHEGDVTVLGEQNPAACDSQSTLSAYANRFCILTYLHRRCMLAVNIWLDRMRNPRTGVYSFCLSFAAAACS